MVNSRATMTSFHIIATLLAGLLAAIAPAAWANTIEVYGRNTNTECMDLDQNIAGSWQMDLVEGAWRLTKGRQSWMLVRGPDDKWRGEMSWPHYGGVRMRIEATLTPRDPPALAFRTAWGCRWGSRKPRVQDDDD